MIKIIHLIPTLEGGGAERQLYMLAKIQKKKGYDVKVLLRRGGIFLEKLKNLDIEVFYIGDNSGISIQTLIRIFKIFKFEKPHVIHSWLPQMDIISGFINYFFNIPWIMTERSNAGAYNLSGVQHRLRVFFSRKASLIITNSISGKAYWDENKKSNTSKVIIIENSIDFENITKSTNNINFKNPLIVSAGSLIKTKNFSTIIKAMNILRSKTNFSFLIIGNGEEKENLIGLINKLNLSNQIKLIPYDINWWEFLNKSDIYISMSSVEGMPNAVLEAIASETITVLSDIDGHRQILDQDSTFFIPTYDHNRLADKLSYILTNLNGLKDKISNAKLKIHNLSIDNIFKKYDSTYKSIIDSNLK